MKYLAIGDSISIDKYTGVPGGGAASQLAQLIGADPFWNLTRDGNTTEGVLADLTQVPGVPDLITLTVGGNDLLLFRSDPEPILANIERIAARLNPWGATVIINTVYDPTDGDDNFAVSMGLPLELRQQYNRLNAGIREIAAQQGYLLADLEQLFHGHGVNASDTWFVQVIEPNLKGASAIAAHWRELLHSTGGAS